MTKMFSLRFDPDLWQLEQRQPVNTLQMFITAACDRRCPECFFRQHFNAGAMTLDFYRRTVEQYRPSIGKVIILGGEPTLHRDLPAMLAFNRDLGLPTTLYTNGRRLMALAPKDLAGVSVRLSVDGLTGGLKPALALPKLGPVIMPVFMTSRNNTGDLLPFLDHVERSLGCTEAFISSIRDIQESSDFWLDTSTTLPLRDYAATVQRTIDAYRGRLTLHISRRGVIAAGGPRRTAEPPNRCRFGNVLPDGRLITCPFDICKNRVTDGLRFGEQRCEKTRGGGCLLQKLVLRRKPT
ncbi:MAG: radical SAM protein [Patescibacteria group bacterium]|jgi:hypothetical protein